MRILHVAATYLPATRYGGTIVSVHGLAKALAARGHEVSVFTTSVDGPADSLVRHDEPVMLDGVRVVYFRSPLARRIYYSPALGNALRRHIEAFDVVHTHGVFLWPVWAAARTAARAGVPFVASPRGMLERELFRRKNRLLKSLWTRLIERRSLEAAAAVHTTSRREAAELDAFKFRLKRVVTVPNGVELRGHTSPEAVSPAIARAVAQPRPIVFIGRISWKKGLDRLLAALERLPDLQLLIAGNDEDGCRTRLESQARHLGLEHRVTFLGEVGGADKQALLDAAIALVLPSYSENFGNVVLEAMARGCPVVVTPEVGASDIVREFEAGIVANGDANDLSAAIDRLASDKPLRARMGQRGVEAAASHGWPAIAARMEALYEALARR